MMTYELALTISFHIIEEREKTSLDQKLGLYTHSKIMESVMWDYP
jgi:hypothetical protein